MHRYYFILNTSIQKKTLFQGIWLIMQNEKTNVYFTTIILGVL